MGDNRSVSNCNATLATWNDEPEKIRKLLTRSPQTLKDGQVWASTLIGGLLITLLSFVMILTVYGRMFFF